MGWLDFNLNNFIVDEKSRDLLSFLHNPSRVKLHQARIINRESSLAYLSPVNWQAIKAHNRIYEQNIFIISFNFVNLKRKIREEATCWSLSLFRVSLPSLNLTGLCQIDKILRRYKSTWLAKSEIYRNCNLLYSCRRNTNKALQMFRLHRRFVSYSNRKTNEGSLWVRKYTFRMKSTKLYKK